jgi:hypothetical protein
MGRGLCCKMLPAPRVCSALVIQWCYSVVTVVLQWCYQLHAYAPELGLCHRQLRGRLRIPTGVSQWCYSGVIVVLQSCYRGVTVTLQ